MRRLAFLVCFLLITLSAFAGDPLSEDRDTMRSILKNVSSEIGKNYFDPTLHGLDWKAATEEARKKIDGARSVNEMEAAIYDLVDRLGDSHTFFVPPMSSNEPHYGFDVKPFGDEIRVYDIDPKGAAAHAGLQVGDRVVELAGHPVDRESIFRTLAFARLLYCVSPMTLVVQRPGAGTLELAIVPKIITRPIVTGSTQHFAALWSLVMDNWSEWSKRSTYRYGVEDGVGYFQVREFPEQGKDFLTGVAEKTQGSKALILDLRDNPGGSVDTLLAFAGLFQDADSDMASAVDRKKTKPLKVKARRPFFNLPLYILVDSTTASAAEMLTRHLQNNRKAVVIGDKTLAAVTMAEYRDAEVGASMVTSYGINIGIAKIILPDGEILEKKGITPDVKCVPTQADMREKKDPCLAMAFKLAKQKIAPPPPAVATATPSVAQ